MTTLTAVYDLAVGPVSYDVVPFLVQAEMERRKIEATRMHVCLVGEPRIKPQYDESEASWRLWNICLPAAKLFGATVSLCTDWLQVERMTSEKAWKQWPPDWRQQSLKRRHHLIGGVISRHAAGESVPSVNASEHARRKVRSMFATKRLPVVTMTLRNTYLPERNIDPKEWAEAKRYIERRDYAVVVLHDTDVALSAGQGYGEFNLDLRAACYQEAAFNLQANNGAASLCWFSDRPYAMFGAGIPADEWSGLFVRQGLPIGKTWGWALPCQKIVYRQPNRDVIIEEFEANP